MTERQTVEAVREIAAAVDHLAGHLERLTTKGTLAFPLIPDALTNWNDDDRVHLHAFLRMFEQLVDLIGRRALRGILLLLGEDSTEFSARDVWDRAEKLCMIESSDAWRDIVKVRNALAHDYPTNNDLHASLANNAFEALPTLLAAARSVLAYIEREKLLG
jgi:uncharacterized protein with HEPN domain